MIIAGLVSNAFGQEGIQVGEEVAFFRESPHPYSGSQEPAIVWRDTIVYTTTECSYIALYFRDVDLDDDDKIVVRSLDSLQVYEYPSALLMADTFWGVPIYGNTTIIEIHSVNSSGGYGYVIDKIARGFTHEEFQESSDPRSSCGADLMQAAKCYQLSEPAIYQHAVPVARVWRNATDVAGTGWLIGSEGHLMTNAHVITGPNNTHTMRVEMMAEGSCGPGCNAEKACPGHFVKHMDGGADLIRKNNALDYSLILLHNNPTNQYGYLQLRASGPVLNERAYIPNHGNGWGKRIAVHSDHPQDNDVVNISIIHDENAGGLSCPPNQPGEYNVAKNKTIEYRAFTTTGTSGSPVIGYSDNLVVGLHFCGWGETECHSRGVNILRIIEDMNNHSVTPQNAIGTNVDPCSLPYQDIEVTEDWAIWQDFYSTGNIIVKNGVDLRIHATVFMREGTHILVERNARLVILGPLGKVTRGCGANHWSGIHLLGNTELPQPGALPPWYLPPLTVPDQAGQVILMPGGTIEWAEIGITSARGYSSTLSGGLVISLGGKFRNNLRDLDFMPYDFLNRSFFYNTDFWSNIDDVPVTQGVWIWENKGISFTKCSFSGYDFEAIRAFDASLNILDGNYFYQNERGISIEATYPLSSSVHIGSATAPPNNFNSNTYHIVASSVNGLTQNSSSLNVINNNFFGGSSEIGVVVAGPSDFLIGGNHFMSMDRGILLFHTNYNALLPASVIACNLLESKHIGVGAGGDNHKLYLWSNEFNQNLETSKDLVVGGIVVPGFFSIPGSIGSVQGHPTLPSDNCFSDPEKADIYTYTPTHTFHYWYRDADNITCLHEPVNPGPAIANYTKENALSINSYDCTIVGGNPMAPSNPEFAHLIWLLIRLDSLSNYVGIDMDSTLLYMELSTEKDELLKYLLLEAIDNSDFALAEQLLVSDQSADNNWSIYGLRLKNKDYVGAMSWLQQMPTSDAFDHDFKKIQIINLNYRQNPYEYVLSENDYAFLENVASGLSPVREYARSLLGLITGQRFDPGFSFGAESLPPPMSLPVAENNFHEGWNLFPNPTSSSVILSWIPDSESLPWRIELFDMLGQQVSVQMTNAAIGFEQIDLGHLNGGLYIVSVFNESRNVLVHSLLRVVK